MTFGHTFHQAITIAALTCLLMACSKSEPEAPKQATPPAETITAIGAGASQPITPASASGKYKAPDLSPGPLPGAGVAQPGLMPGHVTTAPR